MNYMDIQPAADILARIIFGFAGVFAIAVLVPALITLVRLSIRP